jgi:hypothetical protein
MKEYIPRLLAELMSNNPLICQSTTFAVGAYAEHLKEEFAPHASQGRMD